MNKISNWVKYCLEALPYKNGYVLDLACGKGRHSTFLSNLGYNVLSVDIDRDKLNFFNGKLIKKKVIDVEDINNWPLEKRKFNAIIVTNFLNRTIFPLIISSIQRGGYLSKNEDPKINKCVWIKRSNGKYQIGNIGNIMNDKVDIFFNNDGKVSVKSGIDVNSLLYLSDSFKDQFK